MMLTGETKSRYNYINKNREQDKQKENTLKVN
jgi:hypothetical protein